MPPYNEENCPVAKVASQPPTVERYKDCGECPVVNPRA